MDPVDDFWACSFVLDPAGPVRLVSAASGLVIAAGNSLHVLRPGSQRLRSRALPPDLEVVAVAAEPWSPHRLAIASPTSVGVYTGHQPHEPLQEIRFTGPKFGATHLAWCQHDGATVLYLRQRTGEVARLNLDDATTSTLTAPPVVAIAGDEKGVFAMLDLNPVEPANVGDAWILPAGAREWTTRWVDCGTLDEEDQWRIHLAVHGAAVAYSMDPLDTTELSGSVETSWEEEEEDGPCSFASAPGVFMGPIAFQSERVIFAAYNVEGKVNVLRHERNGSFTRIARFGLDDAWEGTEATVTALAWDSERRALWAASPELGLIKLTDPRGAGGKKVAPN